MAGQPTKYKEEYNQTALNYLAKGKSITQLARLLKVSRETIYHWGELNPAFSDTLRHGRQLSQAHWEDELENMMYSKDVNAPLVKLYFANRFGWSDKQEVDNTSSDGSMAAKPTTINLVAPDLNNDSD